MTEFYPVLPANTDINRAFEILPDLLRDERVSALRFCLSPTCCTALSDLSSSQNSLFKKLAALCWEHNTAFIIAPERTTLLERTFSSLLGAGIIDGIHLGHYSEFAKLQSLLRSVFKDKKHNLQSGCLVKDLDEAMTAGEAGADYVALPATAIEALQQWHHMAELPSVAEYDPGILLHPARQDERQQVLQNSAKAGADFFAFPLQLDGRDSDYLLL